MSGWPCAGMPAVPPPGIELKGMSARKDAQRDERTVYRQSTDRGWQAHQRVQGLMFEFSSETGM
eukprot:scaffold307117_cov15-Tisochrysis_lutea.AAC.1